MIFNNGKLLIILAYSQDIGVKGVCWDGYFVRTLDKHGKIEEWWTPCVRSDNIFCPD